VLDVLGLLFQVGLEHFKLKANAPGFPAHQEFRVGKGQST